MSIDSCCSKLCQILNNNIRTRIETLNSIVATKGTRKNLRKTNVYKVLTYGAEALDNHRKNLKEKGSCICEEIPVAPVPGELPPLPAIKERPRIQIRGPTTGVRKIIEERSIIPKTNACCPDACKILNNEIDEMDKILYKAGFKDIPSASKDPKYGEIVFKSLGLKEYRSELRDIGGCKCSEREE